MARPNNQTAIQAHITGLREAKAAFQAMPEIMRDELNRATETTVREIVRLAKARVAASPAIRTRALFNSINWTLNRKSGRGRAGVSSGSTTVRTSSTSTGKVRNVRVKGVIVPGKDGGQIGARLVRPSRYAHFIEFGAKHKHMPAEPFMVPSAEAEKKPYLDRCRVAGKKLEQKMAQIGGGGRHL